MSVPSAYETCQGSSATMQQCWGVDERSDLVLQHCFTYQDRVNRKANEKWIIEYRRQYRIPLLFPFLHLYNFTALLFDQQKTQRLVSALDRIDNASGQRSLCPTPVLHTNVFPFVRAFCIFPLRFFKTACSLRVPRILRSLSSDFGSRDFKLDMARHGH